MRKRKRGGGGDNVFPFNTFGEEGNPSGKMEGPFRENIKRFLEFRKVEKALEGELPCWSFQLQLSPHPPLQLLLVLYVIEEPIHWSLRFRRSHCPSCTYVGWGHHMICNKKYHFLLSSKEMTVECFIDNFKKGGEDTPRTNECEVVAMKTHMMHGMFHSNGCGHLWHINGIEMGSMVMGFETMGLWDRLSYGLGAKAVSIKDTSTKRGMELRLLHAAAYGEPWFAHWGYKLLSGGHGVTQQTYAAAVAAVHGTPLSAVFSDHHPLLSRYTSLSHHHLHSVGDLIRLLLHLRRRLPPATIAAVSRWPRKRIEMAAAVIVQALKSAPFKWVSRQQVRDAARLHVGDTGLLDHVLKSLGNHIFGRFLVRRCLNPVTKVLQYSLLDLSSLIPQFKSQFNISRAQISKDLAQMYDFFFNSASNSLLSIAGVAILDCKHLVKDFSVMNSSISGELRNFWVRIRDEEGKISPAEYIRGDVLGEGLREKVEREFREIYWGMRGFELGCVVEGGGGELGFVFEVLKNGGGDVQERRGGEVVDCYGCGTKEDDGEKMVCCEICEVWVHSRCVEMPKGEHVSPMFICARCDYAIAGSSSLL